MTNTDADDEDEESFDLTGVFKQPVLSLAYDYVLILEWLFEDDEKTGAELYQRLLLTLPVEKVVHAQCRSRAEVEGRLRQALYDIPTRGIPIVHIEAHGENPEPGEPSNGFVGPGVEGGDELLGWERLGDALRPLNVATKFNLLVVGAACYGEGLMLGAPGGKPMPFVAVVGYTETITSMSLRHSLLQLYRGLLISKIELGEAVEAADRERFHPEDSILRSTSMVVMLAESFIQGTATRIPLLRKTFPDGRGRVSQSVPRSGLDSVSPQALQMLRAGLRSAWSLMWMQDEVPANAQRFAIDADRLIALAIEYADRP